MIVNTSVKSKCFFHAFMTMRTEGAVRDELVRTKGDVAASKALMVS